MKKTRKRVKLCGVDRLMIMVIALLIVFTPVLVVYSKSTLSESNIELERIKRKVEKQDEASYDKNGGNNNELYNGRKISTYSKTYHSLSINKSNRHRFRYDET